MSRGTVVAGGYTFDITEIRLRRSRLEIYATRPGPMPALENEPAAVFGEDGQGLWQGPDFPGASITIRRIKRHETALVSVKLRMTEVVAETVR